VTEEDAGPPRGPVISGGRSVIVLAASAFAAVSVIIVMVVAARVLSVEDNAKFLVFWSLMYGVFQVMGGLQNEATRAVGARLQADRVAAESAGAMSTVGREGARVILMPVILGAVAAALVFGSSPLWGFPARTGATVVVAVVGTLSIIAYGCHLTVVGALAGRKDWVTMSGLSAADPAVRLGAVVIVGLIVGRLSSLELAVTASGVTWLVLALIWRPLGRAVGSRTDVGLAPLLRNGALTMVAAAAGAVLLNGLPLVTQFALADRLTAAGLASLLLAIQLTRAPLMMPLNAFQGVAISAFMAQRRPRLGALVKPMLGVTALGVVIAGAMMALGPWVMRLLYGAQYVVSRPVLGGLTFAAVSIALLTLSGTAAIAISAHRGYLAGWWVGALATVAGLFWLPVPPEWRVVVAVLGGPLLGVAVHAVAIHRAAGRWEPDAAPAPARA